MQNKSIKVNQYQSLTKRLKIAYLTHNHLRTSNKIYVLVDNYPIIFQNGSYLHIMVYDLCIQLKVQHTHN